MKRIPIDAVQPGMRLAADLCDSAGRVLIAAGAELAAATLASLRARGINEVAVEETLSAAEAEERRRAVGARVDHLFRHVRNDPLMALVYDAVRAFRLERLE